MCHIAVDCLLCYIYVFTYEFVETVYRSLITLDNPSKLSSLQVTEQVGD
jgi:hypothetical protein